MKTLVSILIALVYLFVVFGIYYLWDYHNDAFIVVLKVAGAILGFVILAFIAVGFFLASVQQKYNSLTDSENYP